MNEKKMRTKYDKENENIKGIESQKKIIDDDNDDERKREREEENATVKENEPGMKSDR